MLLCLKSLLTWWLEPTFRRMLLASLVLIAVAYQVPFDFDLALGSPLATPIDQPFLAQFYSGEQGPNETYRWTQARSAIVLEGIGSGTPLRLTLRALTLRPNGAALPRTLISMDGHELARFQQSADWQEYAIEIPPARDPDHLQINFKTTTFQNRGDPRALGIAVSEIRIEQPGPWHVTIPSPQQTVLYVLIAVGLYTILRQMGMSARRTLWVAVGCLAAIAMLLIWERPFYTAFSQNIVLLVILNLVLAFTLPSLARGLFLRAGVRLTAAEERSLYLLFLVGFNVRWIAQFYPTTMFGDSLFHLHRLDATAAGQILLPSAAGAIGFEQAIPYPPALYLILTPLTTLFSDHLALLKMFVSLTDALGAVLIFFIVRVSTERSKAAFFAAAVYLLLPIAILDFAWSIYANLLAQAALLLALAIWFTRPQRSNVASLSVMAFALALAFLSHVTAIIFWTGLTIVAAPLLWFGFKNARTALVIRPLFIFAAVSVIAVGMYYAEFVPLITDSASKIVTARVARGQPNLALATVGGGVKYPSIGLVRVQVYSTVEWIIEGAKGLAREARVYFLIWPLVLAPIGFYLLGRRAKGRLLAQMGWAGLITGIFFALVGIILDMHVRYPLFLLPFVAMGSGVTLDELCKRGRIASAPVYLLLAFTAAVSLLLWQVFL